ncbi:hypothetical protein SLE2022_308480 [Rubroshorea leprosula]
MVTNSRTDASTSETVKKTIQSIKEIVKDHSDADIYVALKEANMDPNETTHKLLNQDPFHEVKRKRDRKKESVEYNGVEPRKHPENVVQRVKFRAYPDRSARRGSYTRNPFRGISKEFRVVRDNRLTQNANKESEPPLPQSTTSTGELVVVNVAEKGSIGGGSSSPQACDALSNLLPRHAQDANSNGTIRKDALDEKQTAVSNPSSWSQTGKPNNFQSNSGVQSSSSSVVGVYSSSTDPVHVPSPESRSSGPVGAIKREVGVVGVRRQPFQNAVKDSSVPSSSLSNSHSGRDNSSESFRHFPTISKADQLGHTTATGSIMSSISGSKSVLSNQYGNRPHQQVAGHQKATQHKIEWKPKSSRKSITNNLGIIGTPKKAAFPSVSVNNVKDLESEAAKLQDKLSQVKIYEDENVIIAQHIRVPENDRCQLTFGSFGVEPDSSRSYGPGFQDIGVAEDRNGESVSSDDDAGSKPADSPDDQVRNSGSGSPASSPEHHLPHRRDSASPQNSDSYTDIGLVQDNNQSYAPQESHQQEDPPELPSFSAYDPQTGYDISYFRPTMDDATRGNGLPSTQEVLNSHIANSISASTLAMVQQQQPPVAQMYPQVHVSHFANLMPYRQFLSPVYVPQMTMPGYSSNPGYAHPSNGSSYLLMPGGSSLKYGIQQFKPVPAGSPTGFGTFTSPTGYAINAPGVVGNANGLEDSSRIKYKDGNMYVSNQQADASDLWIQNPRELQGMQSAPYYNMPGQTPHGAYLPSHTGHASFNAAAAQSSHMQFPGLYHPPSQPAAMANPHHLGPAMGANVGVGVAPAAPGAQIGAYQQPQLGHLNWTTNF